MNISIDIVFVQINLISPEFMSFKMYLQFQNTASQRCESLVFEESVGRVNVGRGSKKMMSEGEIICSVVQNNNISSVKGFAAWFLLPPLSWDFLVSGRTTCCAQSKEGGRGYSEASSYRCVNSRELKWYHHSGLSQLMWRRSCVPVFQRFEEK